jgi:hypothetical protein
MNFGSTSTTGFTPATIAAMVIGFLIAWPLGLVVLAYALWGERFGWRARVESFMSGLRDGLGRAGVKFDPQAFSRFTGFASYAHSGDPAFEAYRAAALDRADGEIRRFEAERRAHAVWLSRLRTAPDRAAFDAVLAEKPVRAPAEG